MPFHIDNLVVDDLDAFAFKKLLHQVCPVKMVLAGEESFAVHDAVRGDIFHMVRCVHRPANHSCGASASERFCYGAVRSHFSVRNLARNGIHPFEKIGFQLAVVLDNVAERNERHDGGNGADNLVHVAEEKIGFGLDFFKEANVIGENCR